MTPKTKEARGRPITTRGGRDVHDWDVRLDGDDDRFGTVAEVLLDESGSPRYLDVEIAGSDRHVLVPAGYASADASDEVIRVPGITREGFGSLPPYTGAIPDPAYERNLAMAYEAAYTPDAFYARPDYRASWVGAAHDEGTGGELARVDTLDDIDVADDYADPTGWEVVGADGRRLGEVDHLIGDTVAMKVRYLTLNVDRSIAGPNRKVLVPVGHVELDTKNARVRVSALDTTRVEALPAYQGGSIERDYEVRLGRAYDEAYATDRRYEHPRYSGRHLVGEG